MEANSFTYPATQHWTVPTNQQSPPTRDKKGSSTQFPLHFSLPPQVSQPSQQPAALPMTRAGAGDRMMLRAGSGVPAGWLQHWQMKDAVLMLARKLVKPRGCFQKGGKKGFLVHSCKVFALMLNDNCLQNNIVETPWRH